MHHVLAAATQIHEAAKYYPMTAKDGQAAEEAGIFAGAVAGVLFLLRLVRGSKRPATSS